MKKHLNSFRPMSREEQEKMTGGFTLSWFTYDDYGYGSGSSGGSSSSKSSGTGGTSGTSESSGTSATSGTSGTSAKSKPVSSGSSSSNSGNLAKSPGSTGSPISTSSSSPATQSPVPSIPRVHSQPTKIPPTIIHKTTTPRTSSNSIQTGSAIKVATSTPNTSTNNSTQVPVTPKTKPPVKISNSSDPNSSVNSTLVKPEPTTSNYNKEKNGLLIPIKKPQSTEINQSPLPAPQEISTIGITQHSLVSQSEVSDFLPNQISTLDNASVEQKQPPKLLSQSERPSQTEIGGENLGLWMDQRFLGTETGGFCLAASLLNLYQSQDAPITQRQVMGIMKEAMVTRSWNDNPVVSQNGFVQEPDTFLAIAARHLGQDTLSTGDTKYQGSTLNFAGQTVGLAQQVENVAMSVAQGYLDSFRDHMGYGNSDGAGLVVELRQNNRTHFVSLQGWDLSAMVDPHGGKDRSDWSIASIRVVT